MEGRVRPSLHRYVGALVGGAFGDALGWPHEQRATPASKKAKLGLEAWVKRSGGRFQPHTETLEAGSYSDDTQLVLAVARSRLRGREWWSYLARTELPFWLLYERGGGGATLRAARLLAKGTLPWEAKPADRQRYFEAGGNGAAMRASPHPLIDAGTPSFLPVAQAVLSDAVLTHGHPRALVGSLAYAFAIWIALSPRNTLAYGELILAVRSRVQDWSSLPDISAAWPTWLECAEQDQHFHMAWDQAVGEVMDGLRIAELGLEDGALGNDLEILDDLGAFGKHNGAGTVSAVASIFLASKHAAAPFEGVARAALARGADTDTIAAMTGTLVGAFSGTDWLGNRPNQLQDVEYIERIASALAAGNHLGAPDDVDFVNAKDVRGLLEAMDRGVENVRLPIGLSAHIQTSAHVKTTAANLRASGWKIDTQEGQTLFVKKLKKDGAGAARSVRASDVEPLVKLGVSGTVVATRIIVSNLEASRMVYELALGLRVTNRSDTHLQFGDGFALRQGQSAETVRPTVTLFIGVSNVDVSHRALALLKLPHLGAITHKQGRSAFACVDSDGYHLEVFEP